MYTAFTGEAVVMGSASPRLCRYDRMRWPGLALASAAVAATVRLALREADADGADGDTDGVAAEVLTGVEGYTAWIHDGPCAGSQDHVMTPALQPAVAAVDNMLPS